MRKSMLVIPFLVLALSSCERAADVASRNLSQAADNFEINRRVVFFNTINDTYLLTIEGLCSLGNQDNSRAVTVTCKTGPVSYKKHYLGLSENVAFFAEQLEAVQTSTFHYRVVFRPETILPNIDMRTSFTEGK